MTHLSLVQSNDTNRYGHLKRLNAIERGRFNALDLLVQGAPLSEVLSEVVLSLESATPGLKCSILWLDHNTQTLSPLVAPSLPDEYVAAINNIPIGPDVGCCGAAVSLKKPMIVEDICTHENWADYRVLAERSGLRCCWSHPIISPQGDVYGSFAMYHPQPGAPTQDDLDSLAYEAQIVALLFERATNLEKLQRTKDELERRVEERTKALTESNILLKKALEQRNEVRSQLVEMENMAALGTMMSSLTHEINTPTGVAITAISHLRSIQEQVRDLFKENNLKRSQLLKFFEESEESAEIIERNLIRSTQLIKTFKQLSLDQHSHEARYINICDYMCEILLTLKPRLKRTRHQFCLDIDPDLQVISNPGAISQLMINLILNSAQHGFETSEVGHIFIKAKVHEEVPGQPLLKIVYKDNGKGMSAHTIENIYKPFFTQARAQGGSGLGMHICYNVVVKVLEGHIDCRSKLGKGVEFTINFPVNRQAPTAGGD